MLFIALFNLWFIQIDMWNWSSEVYWIPFHTVGWKLLSKIRNSIWGNCTYHHSYLLLTKCWRKSYCYCDLFKLQFKLFYIQTPTFNENKWHIVFLSLSRIFMKIGFCTSNRKWGKKWKSLTNKTLLDSLASLFDKTSKVLRIIDLVLHSEIWSLSLIIH